MVCQDATPHVPVARHPGDGAWVYAPLGQLLVTDGGRLVVCHACGELLQVLSRGHLRGHGLTLASYRVRFGLAARTALIAPALAQVRRLEAARRHSRGGVLAPFPAVRASRNAELARARRAARAAELGFGEVQLYLRDAYEGRLLSVQEVAREWQCSTRTVRAELAAAGVALRPARRSRSGG